MFKKDIFQDLTFRYNSHAYSGLMGFFMKQCHKQLEKFNFPNNISKVLEIGAGSAPHFNFMNCSYNEYHIAETSDFAKDFHKNNPKVKLLKYDGRNLPYQNETFDRIIISHCLEHILSPEEFIQEMMSKLKKDGVLSISLPTDPGIAWRLGRLFIRLFTIKKTYQISGEEFNYMNATEHVNSIFNLISIIRFNYKNQYEEHFYPMRLKMADLNLFYNVHITKKN